MYINYKLQYSSSPHFPYYYFGLITYKTSNLLLFYYYFHFATLTPFDNILHLHRHKKKINKKNQIIYKIFIIFYLINKNSLQI